MNHNKDFYGSEPWLTIPGFCHPAANWTPSFTTLRCWTTWQAETRAASWSPSGAARCSPPPATASPSRKTLAGSEPWIWLSSCCLETVSRRIQMMLVLMKPTWYQQLCRRGAGQWRLKRKSSLIRSLMSLSLILRRAQNLRQFRFILATQDQVRYSVCQ